MSYDPYAENKDSIEDDAPHLNDEMAEKSRFFLFSPFAIVVMVFIVLFTVVVILGVYRNQQETLKSGEAPDFTLATYEGDEIKLSEYEGNQVVVINFWQTNCAPCHEEAPMLVRVYEAYKDQGVIFIGVNAKDPDKLALEYLADYDITYPNGLDIGDRIQGIFRTTGYPETFVIDRDGNIQRHFAGPPAETILRDEIDRALELG